MTPKHTPNTGNYPAYNNSPLGELYVFKSFKCMFMAPNQVNDLPKTGM